MSKTKVERKTSFVSQLVKLALAGLILVPVCPAAAVGSPVHTDPLNYDPLVKEAYEHYYNLDYEGAISRFEQVRAAHPNDPIATAYLLNCILFS